MNAEQKAREIVNHYRDDGWGERELIRAVELALSDERKQALSEAEQVCRARAAEYTSYRGNQKREAEGCAKAISTLRAKDAS